VKRFIGLSGRARKLQLSTTDVNDDNDLLRSWGDAGDIVTDAAVHTGNYDVDLDEPVDASVIVQRRKTH
jgi:hypothetical protein